MSKSSNILDSIFTWMVRKNISGRFRLLRFLKHHQPYYLVQAKSKHGLLFNLDPEDYLDNIVLKDGYYEDEVLTTLVHNLKNTGVLWDIGANIGLHSLTVKHLCPESQVVCFEPSPFTFSRLYLNANLNNADLILLNTGLGNVNGYFKLSLSISGNSGLTSFKPWNNITYQHSMLCTCEIAANLIKHGIVPMPTVIKIDVEGFEYEVLSGFNDLLENSILRAIVFESAPDFLKNPNTYPLYNLLLKSGFEITPLYPLNKEDHSLPTNYVAKRPD